MRRYLAAASTVLVLALSGCSVPEVPDVTYFRLPPPAAVPRADKPLSSLPIEVDTFNAEGVYSEQALIHTAGTDAGALQTYHYHLWSDPPTHALQARLVDMLRQSGLAPLVTNRLPASAHALRIDGTIRRYERVNDGTGFKVIVVLTLRVEEDEGEPLIERDYRAEEAAADTTLKDTVAAFGVAVDKVFGDFYHDLAALQGDTHAR
jgi:cholesterol transport system auxiliary component